MIRAARTILAAALMLPSAAFAQPAPGEPGRISVIGRAILELPPDYASVQVGVSTRAAAAAAALSENSAAVAKLVGLAREMGVEPRHVATSAVSLQQAYRQARPPGGGSEQQPDGYAAQNVVTIRLADMTKLGDLLRRSVEGGANRIDGIAFGLVDPGRAEREAGAAAARDATERARAIAEAAGVSLGPIDTIRSPAAADRPAPPYGVAMRAMAAPPPRGVPIEAGLVTVSADVEITWRLGGR